MLITVAIILVVLGIAIKYGKLYFLIAGYNTMPKEKKKKYDIEGIATVFKNTLFGMALILILGNFIINHYEVPQYDKLVLFVTIVFGLPYLLIVSNSRKYKKD
ncbi:MAG: DUF3784 domain-containing protein [Flaviramulus sp.]|nr:DUF3784 domain-containing protein [Flaviramulus sp.]NNC49023.1 DUF3784 domain-containing protein [Flaviramulus sp.]